MSSGAYKGVVDDFLFKFDDPKILVVKSVAQSIWRVHSSVIEATIELGKFFRFSIIFERLDL